MSFTVGLVMKILGWSAIINLGILLWWFIAFVSMRDTVYRIHSRWFNLTPAQFDSIHYCGMALYKFLIVIFNLVPYLALRIIV